MTRQRHDGDEIAAAMRRWSELGYEADTLVMEVALRLSTVHAKATPIVEAAHAESGLAPGDFDVLATVYRCGEALVTPSQLVRELLYSKSGTTGRLDRLEKAGLLCRHQNKADRRGVDVALTPAGRSLVERVLPRHIQAERDLVHGLDEQELATLNALLAKLMLGI